MKRVIAVLVIGLMLDGVGALKPAPICDMEDVAGYSCYDIADLAGQALHPGHAVVTSIAVRIPWAHCAGFCPLIRAWAVVEFALGDRSVTTVEVFPDQAGRLMAMEE